MKNIILASLVLATAVFARTETIELTGEYSEQLGNPFKKVLNINKSKNINIYSENKDVVLKVESNLSSDMFSSIQNPHSEKIVIKNKDIENITEDFYIEEFNVYRSKSNAVVVDILSGVVSLTYFNEIDKNQVHHLNRIEVALVVLVNGIKKEIKMDHTLNKRGEDYDWVISSDMTLDLSSLSDKVQEIIETELYILLQKKD